MVLSAPRLLDLIAAVSRRRHLSPLLLMEPIGSGSASSFAFMTNGIRRTREARKQFDP